jgi:hypothetical protein
MVGAGCAATSVVERTVCRGSLAIRDIPILVDKIPFPEGGRHIRKTRTYRSQHRSLTHRSPPPKSERRIVQSLISG